MTIYLELEVKNFSHDLNFKIPKKILHEQKLILRLQHDNRSHTNEALEKLTEYHNWTSTIHQQQDHNNDV